MIQYSIHNWLHPSGSFLILEHYKSDWVRAGEILFDRFVNFENARMASYAREFLLIICFIFLRESNLVYLASGKWTRTLFHVILCNMFFLSIK